MGRLDNRTIVQTVSHPPSHPQCDAAARFLWTALGKTLALVLIIATAPRSHASVILSGGDSTDGWAAPAAPVRLFAYNLGTAGDRTIQGFTFKGWDNSVSTSAPT